MKDTLFSYVCSKCGQVIEPGTEYTDVWTIKGKAHEHTWQHVDCEENK